MRNYTFLFTAVIYLFLGAPADLLAQEHLSVSGRVLDAGTAVPLSGVSVSVKGKPLGTATATAGDFELSVALSPPLTLVFSHLGYAVQEIAVARNQTGMEVNLQPVSILGSRSEARRVGHECVRTCRSRWSPSH